MIRVLVVAGAEPGRPAAFAESTRRLTEAGARVTLIVGEGFPRSRRHRAMAGTNGEKLWWRAMGDARLRKAAARADVLVALDAVAVHTVWQLARRHRGAEAVLGLTPALRCVEARASAGWGPRARRFLVRGPSIGYVREAATRRIRGYGRAAAQHATGSTVQGTRLGRVAWQNALGRLPMPARARLPLARRVADGMVRAGHADQAGSTLTAAVRRVPQPRRRARFLSTPALNELTAGRIPPYLEEAAAAELACADAYLTGQSPGPAAAAVQRAAKLLFHRVLHYDSLTSPAAEDPATFFAPWHRSETCRALAAPRGRTGRPARTETRRLLFLYRINDNFLRVMRDRYAARDDVEVRCVNVHADERLENAAIDPQQYAEHVLGGAPEYVEPVAEALRPHLEWADTVFVDWFSPAAGLLTLLDPGRTRVVVRLHSFEVFDIWPQLADLSRVDELVFVSEHLRSYARAILPGLDSPDGPRTWVLPHPADLSGFDRPKPATARFALGLIGVSAIAKDPRWAIEVLRRLRAEDERYHLRLIGADLRGDTSAAARRYRRAYEEDLAELEPVGAVRRVGQTDDVPGALVDVGTILSSSVRESFHWGLAEGAASHAVPVVRDWPFFPGAAAQLFPATWVAGDPAAAATRILAATATEEAWRKAGAEAAAHTMDTYDQSVTGGAYDRLFGIGPDSSPW